MNLTQNDLEYLIRLLREHFNQLNLAHIFQMTEIDLANSEYAANLLPIDYISKLLRLLRENLESTDKKRYHQTLTNLNESLEPGSHISEIEFVFNNADKDLSEDLNIEKYQKISILEELFDHSILIEEIEKIGEILRGAAWQRD